MEQRTYTIIVDLDGTLANVGHRLHFVQGGGKKDWKSFFSGMSKDPINIWCRDLVRAMKNAGCTVAIVSGRPEDYEKDIADWLRKNDVPYDCLYMRRSGDFRPDVAVKREILYRHFKSNDILFVVDDREEVVQMWREEGLVCLQS